MLWSTFTLCSYFGVKVRPQYILWQHGNDIFWLSVNNHVGFRKEEFDKPLISRSKVQLEVPSIWRQTVSNNPRWLFRVSREVSQAKGCKHFCPGGSPAQKPPQVWMFPLHTVLPPPPFKSWGELLCTVNWLFSGSMWMFFIVGESGFIPVHSQGAGAVMVLTQFYRAQAEATGLFWGSAPLNTKPFKGTSRNKKEDFTITKYSLVKASPFYN